MRTRHTACTASEVSSQSSLQRLTGVVLRLCSCDFNRYRYIKRFYSAPVAPIYCPFPVLTVCTATMPVAQAVPVQQPMAAAAVAVPTAGAVAVPMAASAPPAYVVPSPSPAPFAAAAAVVASPAPMGWKE